MKPAIKFLVIFLGTYFVLSLVYGIWIESLGSRPDIATQWVSEQTAGLLKGMGYEVQSSPNPNGPTVRITNKEKVILNVFEGCNGLNVWIVFLAFILAFGGPAKRMAWFVPSGFLLIHLCNIGRILVLFFLSYNNSTYFYYFHKYVFTALIYLVVFLLWWLWIILNHDESNKKLVSQPS